MKKFILEPTFDDSIDRICKKCGELGSECICNEAVIKIMPKDTYKIHSKLSKVKNKLISSFYPLYIDNQKEILQILKKKLGCGGNAEIVEDFIQINLQGDVRKQANLELKKLGFQIIDS
ncbi:hypothetical protein CCY99_01410 [Helicobacter sp. 16-1353]|uniref:hypothetical protein n=1 Tax=Helicobacter sp. 16-1353 TaxID=2004996 RepID=UPI000DCDB4AD|nr:hypothetical protein [Helicobacter sp. 16-1353]RAX54841.1 hypothetical protein CCY99_01410 [Helicobacter sp. 16-1353]